MAKDEDNEQAKLVAQMASIHQGAKVYARAVDVALKRAHGVAAEKANHFIDKIKLRDAHYVGANNAQNGPDRIVDGIEIQSKYCSSGKKCIAECFDRDGKFRYVGSSGKPMQIEVPRDKYDAAVAAMKHRIRTAQIPGVDDPEEASKIIRKGYLTQKQAINFGRAGTIESVAYDAKNGIVSSSFAFGLSAAVKFAQSTWDGEAPEAAAIAAGKVGLEIGGSSLATTLLSGQLARTGFEAILRPGADFVARSLGPKTAAVISKAISGKVLRGAAAMSHTGKLLRGNIATASVTTLVQSSVDLYRMADGGISIGQTVKNVTRKAAGVAGGTAGYMAGQQGAP